MTAGKKYQVFIHRWDDMAKLEMQLTKYAHIA